MTIAIAIPDATNRFMGASLDDAWSVAGILRSPVTLRNRIRRVAPSVVSNREVLMTQRSSVQIRPLQPYSDFTQELAETPSYSPRRARSAAIVSGERKSQGSQRRSSRKK